MQKIIFPVFIFVLFFAASCQEARKEQPQQRPVALPVVEVPLKDVTAITTYPVSIEGKINSAVRAKVSGYITAVMVDEGQRVRKGQTLFRLETQALSQDAGAAQANVKAAEVEVDNLTRAQSESREQQQDRVVTTTKRSPSITARQKLLHFRCRQVLWHRGERPARHCRHGDR